MVACRQQSEAGACRRGAEIGQLGYGELLMSQHEPEELLTT
jgi:hypothetical protein